ncbi:hypothetical protein ACFVHB_12430 [Kitasatospora sp. NPDC127111]|uniref:hypothetical protein n=1 Tax=Kitasatospora sp. NPDC127111 TaxID=3345363 RepID=UPI00362A5F08
MRRTSLRIHRSPHPSNFVIIPNTLAQNRAMSYTARGLLVDLLSRPDEWRETCRQMADSSPQGRKALESALGELRAFGYYRVEVVQLPNGRLRSEAHVFDTPQLQVLPGATIPASGGSESGERDALLGKNLVKEPSLPSEVVPVTVAEQDLEQGGREGEPDSSTRISGGELDEQTRAAAAVLLRVVRSERRLPLGEAEAAGLAPLVRSWLERGGSEEGLREAMLAGLPDVVYSPAKVLQNRLERKMPPAERSAARTRQRRMAECAECRDPLPEPGACAACAGAGRDTARDDGRERVTARGMAKVRAALSGQATAA